MGLFEKFNKGLKKTRNSMSGAIDVMLHGKNEIDEDLYEELEVAFAKANIEVPFPQMDIRVSNKN